MVKDYAEEHAARASGTNYEGFLRGYYRSLMVGGAHNWPCPALAALTFMFGWSLQGVADEIGVSRPFLSQCYEPGAEKRLSLKRYRAVVDLLEGTIAGAKFAVSDSMNKAHDRPGHAFVTAMIGQAERVLAAEQERLREMEESAA